jgi:hypothetical protein
MANGTMRQPGTRDEHLSLGGLVVVLVLTDVMMVALLAHYGII